jgi:transposase
MLLLRRHSDSMRGDDPQGTHMFSYISPEQRVPADHPLRPIRHMTDTALRAMSPRFATLYSDIGRPSVPPEKLLRALLLQVLYSIRSERQLMEQLDYNLLFRWFVGFNMDDRVWSATTFSKNRDRLLAGDIAQAFFQQVRAAAEAGGLLSSDHFTVDGTLLEAYASLKSFQPKQGPSNPSDDDPGNPSIDFRGQRRSNQTHQSTTDPDSRLFRKADGQPSRLAYTGSALMENRHGLVVGTSTLPATGTAEREAALALLTHLPRRRATIGADKGYNQRAFVEGVRALGLTPHVAEKARYNAIDRRTTHVPGYAVSQRVRKRIEEVFGWMKTVGLLRKLRHRGLARVDWVFTFTAAAYNLVRMRNLQATCA